MCGRTACTLYPHEIQKACAYKVGGGKWKIPDWQEAPSGKEYIPSYNVAPSNHTPVLVSKKHFSSRTDQNERVIQPMYWGISMAWKPQGGGAHNARSETVLDKPTFSKPLKDGRRCVVIIDGYYEWKTSGAKKQPYLIYFPQESGVCIENHNWRGRKNGDLWSVKKGWQGPRLLTLAGIFEVSKPKFGAEVYSYAILTRSSAGNVSSIHDRMPVILDGDDAVEDWLDFGNINANKALQLVKKIPKLQFHMVSDLVNYSKNKTPACMLPIDVNKTTSAMDKWLKGKSKGQSTSSSQSSSSSLAVKRGRKDTRSVSPSSEGDESHTPPKQRNRKSRSPSPSSDEEESHSPSPSSDEEE